MSQDNEFELGELAEYNGVKIVATPNTLSGKPRLEGHRIGVKNILPVTKMDGDSIENALEAYPQLETEQIEAVIQFAEDHTDIMDKLDQREDMVLEVFDGVTRTIQCTCSETFLGLSAWQDHIDDVEPEYKEMNRDDRRHFIEDDWYETEIIVCACGDTFSNPWRFIGHTSYWYEADKHVLETIQSDENE